MGESLHVFKYKRSETRHVCDQTRLFEPYCGAVHHRLLEIVLTVYMYNNNIRTLKLPGCCDGYHEVGD